MGELQLVKKKELRGELLRFLLGIYPEQITKESVYETFYEYWRTDDIDKELAYLVDKRYVSCKETPTPFGPSFEKVVNYKLLPDGKDVVDGVTQDNGVFVRR
jgi:hypothetical protein